MQQVFKQRQLEVDKLNVQGVILLLDLIHRIIVKTGYNALL